MRKPTDWELFDALIDEVAESIAATPVENLSVQDIGNPEEIRARLLTTIDVFEEEAPPANTTGS